VTTLPPPGAGPTRKTTTQIGARHIVVDDLTQAIPGELGTSIAATLQHIMLTKEREERIAEARRNAEDQMLYRIGVAHRTGQIDDVQLFEAYKAYKALGITGRMYRWDAHVDIPWKRMQHLRSSFPNGPEGTWVGDWPVLEGAQRPRPGISVVYVLFGADNEPCYVGSSRNFVNRMRDHHRDGKQFVRWQAYRCRDREHAYELEVRLLKERMPHLNRRAGR
jgi:hypothetical protein